MPLRDWNKERYIRLQVCDFCSARAVAIDPDGYAICDTCTSSARTEFVMNEVRGDKPWRRLPITA